MPIFAQNAKDAREIEASGFRDVRALDERNEIDGITIHKTAGRHGRGAMLEGPIGEILGTVSGFVFEHPNEKKLYVAGDTVWFDGVAAGGRHVVKVTAQADAAGIYYANVVARMITQVQTEARTFSVPVVVGTVAPAQQAAPVTDAAGEAIEPLPAVENGGKEGGGQQ